MRFDGRRADELRKITVQRHFTRATEGSVLMQAGGTTVLCTASIEEGVPSWKKTDDPELVSGWLTAEYSMLPGSTSPRKRRERNHLDGRTSEIQRLIGRSLRAAVDMRRLGARTVTIDCDVLEADGGTRTLSITGGFIALVDALLPLIDQFPDQQLPIVQQVAAVSVGVVDGEPLLDLNYHEDSRAEVDLNVVMTASGEFIELQGTAEGRPFSAEHLQAQVDLASRGIAALVQRQRESLGEKWPLDSIPTSC